MKLSPFKLYVNSLAHGPFRPGYLNKDDALVRLKGLTGEDFGFDVEKWRDWGKANPQVAEGQSTWAFSHKQKPE